MLRVLVITLVLANVLLLAIQLLRPAAVDAPLPANDAIEHRAPVATIQLFSEMDDRPAERRGTAECFTVGPFQSEPEQAAATRLLAPSAIAITHRQTEALVDQGTWVYLPVQIDYITARNMALTMRDAGLGDVNVIRNGEWNNSVSLGYFASAENALQRAREARSLGFAVETRLQQDQQTRFWIDYQQRAGAPYVQVSEEGPIRPELHRYVPCASAEQPSAAEGGPEREAAFDGGVSSPGSPEPIPLEPVLH